MRLLIRARGVLDLLVRAVGALSAIAVGTMMLSIVVDSAFRTLANSSFPVTFDLSQYWYMVTIGFGGLALAQRRNEHIEATFVFDLLPERTRRLWLGIGTVATLAVLSLVLWAGWGFAEINRDRGEYSSGSGLPIWPARYVIPIGAAAFALHIILHLRRRTTGEDDRA